MSIPKRFAECNYIQSRVMLIGVRKFEYVQITAASNQIHSDEVRYGIFVRCQKLHISRRVIDIVRPRYVLKSVHLSLS